MHCLFNAFLIFIAAFISLSCTFVQERVQTLSASVSSLLIAPHIWQVLLDGYHLSIITNCLPYSLSLYFRNVLNMPKPLSFVDLASFIHWAIPHIQVFSCNCIISIGCLPWLLVVYDFLSLCLLLNFVIYKLDTAKSFIDKLWLFFIRI